MKSPRKILLEHHREMDTKLDAIRESVVANTAVQTLRAVPHDSKPTLLRVALTLWRELVLPSRRIWAAFACAWVLIAMLNLAGSSDSGDLRARRSSPPINMALAWQQQQKFLAELNSPEPAPAGNSIHAPSKPRSDCRSLFRSA